MPRRNRPSKEGNDVKSISPSSSTRTIVALLVIVALAIAFWMLLLSPKREEASKLGAEVEQLNAGLAEAQSAVAAGEAARADFAENYQQLVVLGKAVPASDETASLLVQLNRISDRAGISFQDLQLGTADGSETAEEPSTEEVPPEESVAPEEGTGGVQAAAVAPTEAAASLQPLGASVGPAGLSVMPYDLTFSGSFFKVADFIHGLDALIHTDADKVGVDGRLVTIDGFSLAVDSKDSSQLKADFSVTTYLVPPGEGITAGAAPTEPAAENPAATTTDLR
jgi:Tfp pilus assembly protein PilO